MKTVKSDEIEINISVIGLSGSERVKGAKGVGKSCLCNRLTQPDHYKPKHSSVVSSINFFGSEMNNSQWLFWGCVDREIRGKRYRLKFVEQTVMVDDISHNILVRREDYVERATATELRGIKSPHIVSPVHSVCWPSLGPKTAVHMFLLVYDVSEVEGRDPGIQDTTFKQLFDRVIASKRPVIVVSTKHEQASQILVDRLAAVLEKRPYSKYPLVETSASLGVNVGAIVELAVVVGEGGLKTVRQRSILYQDGLAAHEARLDNCRHELRHVAVSMLDSDLWHTSWADLRRKGVLANWIQSLGIDVVERIVDEVRTDMRLKRRVRHQQRHKDGLLQLLAQSQHLLLQSAATNVNLPDVLERLTQDAQFMSHFIPFNRDAEYFDFGEHGNLLPQYILDNNNDNNLIFVIKDYMDQRSIEDQLFNRLITDCPRNFRKTVKEIGDDLKQQLKHFILDKIIHNVYDRFQDYYVKILESQFLETIHENPNLFLSQGILTSINITPENHCTMNGLTKELSFNERRHDSNVFLTTMTKEINSKINFAALLIAEDERHLRESWIRNYLHFLQSSNQFECIYQHLTQCPCTSTIMSNLLSDTDLGLETDVACLPHSRYIVVLGNNGMKYQLKELIMSFQNKLTQELCKVHCTKYDLKLLDNIDMLRYVINELCDRGDKCCSVCVLICVESAQSQSTEQIDDILFLERSSNYKLTKYLVHKVVEESLSIRTLDDSIIDQEHHCHINDLLSDNKRLVEPSIIWVVTICGDQYNYDSLLTFLINILKFHSIPRRMNGILPTISGCFTSKEIDRHNYRLCFISYHEAMKIFIRSPKSPPIDGLFLVCSLERLASLNTCLAIRKYLPAEIKSVCHFMLLGVVRDHTVQLKQARIKAEKHAMKYACVTLNKSNGIVSDISDKTEQQLLDYLICVFKGPPMAGSIGDISTNTSSLSLHADVRMNNQMKSSNQICKVCGQCRSNENVNSVMMLESSHEAISEMMSYDEVLGEKYSDLFDNYNPESVFNEPCDASNKCTEVKCNIHPPAAQGFNVNHSQQFRTRMRSQSGPDLSNFFDSNKSSLNQSASSTKYCDACGAKMSSYSTDHTDSRKTMLHKTSSDKESHSKKLIAQLHDIFTPSRRPNDTQAQEQRKTFVRSSSKRHK